MRIGIPKESKDQERRAGITPAGVNMPCRLSGTHP